MSRLIVVLGVDGSGKSTIVERAIAELRNEGAEVAKVWSRFRNYFSLPLLAATRLTGHNHYRDIAGTRVGYHRFESLRGFRKIYALLQAVDANIGYRMYIATKMRRANITFCERGPIDTLVDVSADTGLDFSRSLWRMFTLQYPVDTIFVYIRRSADKIVGSRPSLIHDEKLDYRMRMYEALAQRHHWEVIENSGTLDAAVEELVRMTKK